MLPASWAEFSLEGFWLAKFKKYKKPADYAKALEALVQVICFTLMKTGGTSKCPLHRALFKLVQPRCVRKALGLHRLQLMVGHEQMVILHQRLAFEIE